MAAFIDDGDGPTWADALLFPPFIADERDGTTFRNLPAMAFKRLLDAAQGDGDTDRPAFTRDVRTPHSPASTDERQSDHD